MWLLLPVNLSEGLEIDHFVIVLYSADLPLPPLLQLIIPPLLVGQFEVTERTEKSNFLPFFHLI